MAPAEEKKDIDISVVSRTNSSNSAPSVKSPRTPRFAEATSVNSPIEPGPNSRPPFNDAPRTSQYYQAQPQVSDVGFGYIGERNPNHLSVEMPITPASPLKSALRTPGAPPRAIATPGPLATPGPMATPLFSPTWDEENRLEKREQKTEKEQQKDLKIKVRVRMAKMALRFTNFSCSLIVLSMLSSTFSIFNATKDLPARNNLPPWAANTKRWPAITLLVISCVSLFMAVLVFWGYWRGGHRRAEKQAAYYSMFAVGFFVFSIVMWGVGAGVLQQTRNNSGGQDIWGWSCKNNARKTIFQNDVHYDLVCRLQNWSLVCCLIEVIVEVITITIYGVVFYRFYSKRRLRKSMAKRDTAREDLYLAQLKSQSQPGTPGLASPRDGGYNPMFSPRFAAEKNSNIPEVPPTPRNIDAISAAEEGHNVRYIDATTGASTSQPFRLQSPPPKRSTPKTPQEGFQTLSEHAEPIPREHLSRSPTPAVQHVEAAPGEETYDAVPIPGAYQGSAPQVAHGEEQYESVPIPGAYEGAINSPTHVPGQQGYYQSM
ncbi:MAG: hypothetical protein M1828_000116 [Chrysothrix sp. TS-e1954]|nr:MAG: hypothetical protein M1828_000116 [Chrysothrix sp. TS-e1954]